VWICIQSNIANILFTWVHNTNTEKNSYNLKNISQTWWSSVGSILQFKLLWFVSELPEKDISNVVVQCRGSYNKLSWFVSELPEKDISNVVVQCR
jgi:hypothetical protein